MAVTNERVCETVTGLSKFRRHSELSEACLKDSVYVCMYVYVRV